MENNYLDKLELTVADHLGASINLLEDSTASLSLGTLENVSVSNGRATPAFLSSQVVETVHYEHTFSTQPFVLSNSTQILMNDEDGPYVRLEPTASAPTLNFAGIGSFNPASANVLELTYRVASAASMTNLYPQIYFYNTGFPSATSSNVKAGSYYQNDGQWRKMYIYLGNAANFNHSNLTGFRLDFVQTTSVILDLKQVRLLNLNASAVSETYLACQVPHVSGAGITYLGSRGSNVSGFVTYSNINNNMRFRGNNAGVTNQARTWAQSMTFPARQSNSHGTLKILLDGVDTGLSFPSELLNGERQFYSPDLNITWSARWNDSNNVAGVMYFHVPAHKVTGVNYQPEFGFTYDLSKPIGNTPWVIQSRYTDDHTFDKTTTGLTPRIPLVHRRNSPDVSLASLGNYQTSKISWRPRHMQREELTVEFWVYDPKNFPSTQVGILSKGGFFNHHRHIGLSFGSTPFDNTGNLWSYRPFAGPNQNIAARMMNSNEPQHIVYQLSNTQNNIYINGKLWYSYTKQASEENFFTLKNYLPFALGAAGTGKNPSRLTYAGLAVYDKMLSRQRILEHYVAGMPALPNTFEGDITKQFADFQRPSYTRREMIYWQGPFAYQHSSGEVFWFLADVDWYYTLNNLNFESDLHLLWTIQPSYNPTPPAVLYHASLGMNGTFRGDPPQLFMGVDENGFYFANTHPSYQNMFFSLERNPEGFWLAQSLGSMSSRAFLPAGVTRAYTLNGGGTTGAVGSIMSASARLFKIENATLKDFGTPNSYLLNDQSGAQVNTLYEAPLVRGYYWAHPLLAKPFSATWLKRASRTTASFIDFGKFSVEGKTYQRLGRWSNLEEYFRVS